MDRVEFVSYDGKFPNLCSGTLVLKIDGIEREMPPYSLTSGGTAYITPKGDEIVGTGRWSVSVPDDLIDLQQEIEECVNENVPWGCCGGCI